MEHCHGKVLKRKAIMPCLEPPQKIQKFKNLTIEKKIISLVQLTHAAISLLNL